MRNIQAVSTLVTGQYGITNDVYLSLPCVLTSNAVSQIVKQNLTESEIIQLQTSAHLLHEIQVELNI